MKEKLAVTIWNYKGGVGKSTISLILAEIAAQNGKRVLAIDLDEQHNLSEMLRLTGTSFAHIHVRDYLDKSFANEDYNLFIIDTHPSKNNSIQDALQFADIVLIPVFCDFQSVVNLRSVFNYITSCGVGAGQIALVKNCVEARKLSTETETVLDSMGYSSAAKLPRNNQINRNIASGYRWDKSMRSIQREPFISLYHRLWSAYDKMSKGTFHHLWEDK